MQIILFTLLLSLLTNCSSPQKPKEQVPQATQTETIEEKETPGQYFMARFDQVKYPQDFKNFAYVNPNAPKGGTLRLATVGTFDKVNFFLLKGKGSQELKDTFDGLMVEAKDEPYSKYGLIIQTCEIAENKAWVRFYIRPQARFHDGTPVTSESIKQTIETLQKDGILPVYKRFYSRIKDIETPDTHTITIHFKPDDKGQYDPLFPMVMANIMPVGAQSLPTLPDNVLTPVVGAGPYMIKEFDLGQFLHFVKVPNYWANNLPVTHGKWNFNDIKITYFKNDRALAEAFKKGDFDVHFFTDPQQFETFQCPDHRFTKLDFKHKRPVQVQTIALNQKTPALKNQSVRDALNLLFSFKDINHVCFSNTALYARSLFENTGLGHKGIPDAHERAIWEKLKNTINDGEFYDRLITKDISYFTKGSKEERLQQAEQLLDKAGYKYNQNLECRVNAEGHKLEFDMIIRQSRAKFSRFLSVFKNDLEKIGIKLTITMLEESMYRQREDAGYYDMMILPYTMGMSPGVELLSYFGKVSGLQKGSVNYMNLIDDVAETLAQGAVNAHDQEELEAHVKALDRYLCLRGYLILCDYSNSLKLVYRNDRIDFPKNPMADINVWERGWSVV